MPIREVKPEIRILGWDDAPFEKQKDGEVPLVGSVVRGGKPYLEGVLVRQIKKDGKDATRKIADATNETRHRDQLRVVMLDGITFAGFNTVDVEKIHEDTGLPVLVVTRKEPDFERFKDAMKKLPGFEERWECVERAGEFEKMKLKEGEIYFQKAGLDSEKAKRIVEMSISNSLVPEPIRISHLIASAIVRGESVAGA